tara:strand:- start:834 stop:1052 length:219 start_codon:yes stop_codon:yes gene_type:complete
MKIKNKNRDPKKTDFGPTDIIINTKEGTLFYKANNNLYRVQGDNIDTPETEIIPPGEELILSGSVSINGGSF